MKLQALPAAAAFDTALVDVTLSGAAAAARAGADAEGHQETFAGQQR